MAGKKKDEIKRIFEEGKGSYGAQRICGIIRKKGGKASYGKVQKYMREMHLSSVHNKRRSRSLTDTTKARSGDYPNLTRGKVFYLPLEAVCSDITYIRTDEGWLYLCTVKDIVTGEILGSATSERMKKELVINAFLNAHARHCFGRSMIFHCDRGSQYTSKDFMNTVKNLGVVQSFSRVGMPGDNSWAESFFATVKKELVHITHFTSREQARSALFGWIECFYNTIRVQKRLGYLSPRNFCKSLNAARSAA